MKYVIQYLLAAVILGIGINHAYAAPGSPKITDQPDNITVVTPVAATFRVTATGNALSYQWKKSINGGAFNNISGATAAVYNTGATGVLDDGNRYRCVVTNTAGSVTSGIATLTVHKAP